MKRDVPNVARFIGEKLQRELTPPRERRKAIADAPEAYQDSVIVQKAKELAAEDELTAFIFDKDGCIQLGTAPTLNPSQKTIAAAKDLNRRTRRFLWVQSSAQTAELSISAEARWLSRTRGFDRPPPIIVLPDGRVTSDPTEVPEWALIANPDAFVGFGSGLSLLQSDGSYANDHAFEAALGGARWRPNTEALLRRMYPDGSIFERLGRVDHPGQYPNGVNVSPLPFRFQVEDYGEEGLRKKNELMLKLEIEQLRGYDAVGVDETSLRKNRYITYVVPRGATKERGVGRLFKQLTRFAGLTFNQYKKVVMVGDTLTDLCCGEYGLPWAKDVTFILAAESELSEPLLKGHREFADIPLIWSRQHPGLAPRFEPTEVPGVFKFHAHKLLPWRTIILAHYAPWSKGLDPLSSVVASIDHMGYH